MAMVMVMVRMGGGAANKGEGESVGIGEGEGAGEGEGEMSKESTVSGQRTTTHSPSFHHARVVMTNRSLIPSLTLSLARSFEDFLLERCNDSSVSQSLTQ